MSMIEGLEGRELLAASTELVRVKSITADNRGEVQIQLSNQATGVRGSAVQLYTAGPDGVLFTNDDKRETVRFTYSENRKLIKITANLPKDTAYRVKLDGKTRITDTASGLLLDGDYSANGASGDGKAGGNYEAQFGRDRSSTPVMKMSTSQGDIQIKLRRDIAGIQTTVDNFVSYANQGKLDNTIYHRIVTVNNGGIGIVQGGGFYSTSEDSTSPFAPNDTVVASAPIALQAGFLSNLAGTLAMARTGVEDSATSQFYFNVTDNTALDKSSNNAGYAVFGQVVGSASTATLAKIYGGTPTSFGQSGIFSSVPEVSSTIVTTYRAAMFMTVSNKLGVA